MPGVKFIIEMWVEFAVKLLASTETAGTGLGWHDAS